MKVLIKEFLIETELISAITELEEDSEDWDDEEEELYSYTFSIYLVGSEQPLYIMHTEKEEIIKAREELVKLWSISGCTITKLL